MKKNYEFVDQEDDNLDDGEPPEYVEDYDISGINPDFGPFLKRTANENEEDENENSMQQDSPLAIHSSILANLTSTIETNSEQPEIMVMPDETKLVYVNPGFTKVAVNMTGFSSNITSRSILVSCFRYIKQHSSVNKKLKIDIIINSVDIPGTSAYYQYLSALCDYVYNGYYIKINKKKIGIPLIKAGKNNMVVCGCCGDLINDMELQRHANDKIIWFTKFVARKFSCCPWCKVDFETDEDSLIHWFDENHTIVSCKNIIGEQDGCVNDSRLHKGLPLPYTPFVQAAITCFLQLAPLASIILCQRVTKIDLANTNELPSCLSVEIADLDKSDFWIPDCSMCNERYYHHNVVHYSSIGAYDKESIYGKRECGHIIPAISKAFIGSIGLSMFNDMYDKMNGKKKKYGCATFKTAAKKDYYDDEGPMRKRFSTLLETYRSASNTSTKNYYDNILNSNYYSQLNHQALMFAYERSLYDKYSGGEHITALDYDDDAGDVLIDLVCKNMEILHSFEVEKKKKKNNKKQKQLCT